MQQELKDKFVNEIYDLALECECEVGTSEAEDQVLIYGPQATRYFTISPSDYARTVVICKEWLRRQYWSQSRIAKSVEIAMDLADGNTERFDMIVAEGREWLKECYWDDLSDEEIDDLSDKTVLMGIRRHFEGGLAEFVEVSFRAHPELPLFESGKVCPNCKRYLSPSAFGWVDNKLTELCQDCY